MLTVHFKYRSSGNLRGGEVHGMMVSKDLFVVDCRNQLNSMANTLVNGDVQVTLPAGATRKEQF